MSTKTIAMGAVCGLILCTAIGLTADLTPSPAQTATPPASGASVKQTNAFAPAASERVACGAVISPPPQISALFTTQTQRRRNAGLGKN